MHAQPFVPYPGFVSDIKKTYSKDYLKAQHALGVNVRDYKEWDKNDLVALYDSYFGKVIFAHLVQLVAAARAEEQMPHSFAFAQNDLNQIAPHGMDWRGYDAMMMAAIAEIKASSFRVALDFSKLLGEAPAAPEAPAFDPQAALARLDGVTTTASAGNTGEEAVLSFRRAAARLAS